MPNGNQKSALRAIDTGHTVHKTTVHALLRKGLIEPKPLGRWQLTDVGKQYV